MAHSMLALEIRNRAFQMRIQLVRHTVDVVGMDTAEPYVGRSPISGSATRASPSNAQTEEMAMGEVPVPKTRHSPSRCERIALLALPKQPCRMPRAGNVLKSDDHTATNKRHRTDIQNTPVPGAPLPADPCIAGQHFGDPGDQSWT